MFKTAAVSVTTTATRLDTFSDDPNPGVSVLVVNEGAVTVYLGGSGVSTADGVPLTAGASFTADGTEIFGRVAAGTCECRVASMGVA